MKKNVFLRAGIILLCLITTFAGLPVCAEETDAKHYYELNVNYNLFYNKSTQKTEAEITGGYAQLSQEDDASEDKSHIVVAIPSEISVSVWNNSVEQKQYYPVTRIARNAFRYINEYGEIVIPASVTDIDSRAFANGGIMSYNVDPENKNYMSSNGVIFSKDGKTLLIYPAGSEAAIYNVPEGTEKIGDYAFLEIRNLMQVNLPDSVTEIGKSAFKECWALRGISIPDSVTKIGEEAFSCCNSLRGIYIPALKNVSRTDIFDNYNVTIYTPSNSSLLEEGNNVKEMNNRIVRLDVRPLKSTYIESDDKYYLVILSLNLTFADGSEEYFDSLYKFQEKYGIYLEAESDQYSEAWGIGSHSFYVSAFGLTCEVPVTVVENPFESWEVITDIKVTDHMGGYYDYDNNGNMYYNYDIKELVKVKVKYKSSGEEKVISLREYASEGRYNYNMEITVDAYDMPNWRGGGQYRANLIIGNYYIGLIVTVNSGPYDKLNVTLADKKSEYLPYELPDLENAVIELSSTSDDKSYAAKKYTVYHADYAGRRLYARNEDTKDCKEFEIKIISDRTIEIYEYDGAPVYTVNYNVKTDSDGNEITVSNAYIKKQPDDVYGNGAVIGIIYSDDTETEINVTDIYGGEMSPYKNYDGKLMAYTNGYFRFNNGAFPIEIERVYENSVISQLKIVFCGYGMPVDSSIVEKDKVNLSTDFAYFRHLYELAFNGTINKWNIDMIVGFLYSQSRFYYYRSAQFVYSANLDDVNTAISDIFDVDLSKGDAKLSQYYNSESGCLEIEAFGFGDDFALKLYKERDHGDGNTSYECIFGYLEEEDSREAVSISLKNGKIAAVSRFVSCGDANADGKIDILDLVRTKKIIAGTASAECAEFAADTNGSGEVNAEDLAWLRYMLINAEK